MKGPITERTYAGSIERMTDEYGTRDVPRVRVYEGPEGTGGDENRVHRLLPTWDDDGHDSGYIYDHGSLTWGYGGSGPHDLAYNILADALDEEWATPEERREGKPIAWQLKHEFVVEVVSHWPMDGGWRLAGREVVRWLRSHGVDWAGSGLRFVGSCPLYNWRTYDFEHAAYCIDVGGTRYYVTVGGVEDGDERDPRKLGYYATVYTDEQGRVGDRHLTVDDASDLPRTVGNYVYEFARLQAFSR